MVPSCFGLVAVIVINFVQTINCQTITFDNRLLIIYIISLQKNKTTTFSIMIEIFLIVKIVACLTLEPPPQP